MILIPLTLIQIRKSEVLLETDAARSLWFHLEQTSLISTPGEHPLCAEKMNFCMYRKRWNVIFHAQLDITMMYFLQSNISHYFESVRRSAKLRGKISSASFFTHEYRLKNEIMNFVLYIKPKFILVFRTVNQTFEFCVVDSRNQENTLSLRSYLKVVYHLK